MFAFLASPSADGRLISQNSATTINSEVPQIPNSVQTMVAIMVSQYVILAAFPRFILMAQIGASKKNAFFFDSLRSFAKKHERSLATVCE